MMHPRDMVGLELSDRVFAALENVPPGRRGLAVKAVLDKMVGPTAHQWVLRDMRAYQAEGYSAKDALKKALILTLGAKFNPVRGGMGLGVLSITSQVDSTAYNTLAQSSRTAASSATSPTGTIGGSSSIVGSKTSTSAATGANVMNYASAGADILATLGTAVSTIINQYSTARTEREQARWERELETMIAQSRISLAEREMAVRELDAQVRARQAEAGESPTGIDVDGMLARMQGGASNYTPYLIAGGVAVVLLAGLYMMKK